MFERISKYRIVWLQVCFDLPVALKKQRKDYATFRKNLLKDGFIQFQYSVYLRYCGSHETANVHESRVKKWLPEEGHIWVLRITDTQYSKSKHYWGKKRNPDAHQGPNAQLEMF
jgi:CRISPR-associated protein Cas2